MNIVLNSLMVDILCGSMIMDIISGSLLADLYCSSFFMIFFYWKLLGVYFQRQSMVNILCSCLMVDIMSVYLCIFHMAVWWWIFCVANILCDSLMGEDNLFDSLMEVFCFLKCNGRCFVWQFIGLYSVSELINIFQCER